MASLAYRARFVADYSGKFTQSTEGHTSLAAALLVLFAGSDELTSPFRREDSIKRLAEELRAGFEPVKRFL
jgi:hypothetical protein